MPKFSIIIPVYNVALYLRECLDSVMAQTFTDWEAICVDDGSTDESGEILDEYAAKDGRFRIVHQPNAGVSAARNAALGIVRGKWICFVDGDDIVNPGMVAIFSKASDCIPRAEVIRLGEPVKFSGNGGISWTGESDFMVAPQEMDVHDTVSPLFLEGGFWRFAYRREVIHGVQFAPFVVGEDRLFLKEVAIRTNWIAVADIPIYGYRNRAGSAMESRMNSCKLLSEVGWRIRALRLFSETKKTINPRIFRGQVLSLTEWFSYKYFRCWDGDMIDVWNTWLSVLSEVDRMELCPLWSRFAVKCVLALPFRAVAFLMFTIPYWLKMKGLHR